MSDSLIVLIYGVMVLGPCVLAVATRLDQEPEEVRGAWMESARFMPDEAVPMKRSLEKRGGRRDA